MRSYSKSAIYCVNATSLQKRRYKGTCSFFFTQNIHVFTAKMKQKLFYLRCTKSRRNKNHNKFEARHSGLFLFESELNETGLEEEMIEKQASTSGQGKGARPLTHSISSAKTCTLGGIWQKMLPQEFGLAKCYLVWRTLNRDMVTPCVMTLLLAVQDMELFCIQVHSCENC